MPRGRKPKPTYLRLLEGNPQNRPINKNEPRPKRYQPEAPAILTADAKIEWERIVEEVYNLGLLTIVDVQGLAAYCQSYGRWIVAERCLAKMAALDQQVEGLMIKGTQGQPVANPLVYIAAKAARDMMSYAAEFGFTPAARTRIAIAQAANPESKFAGLLR
jgi:P27 family predicted phage terminase small subunit